MSSSVIPIRNRDALAAVERLRDLIISGDATAFYAISNAEDPELCGVFGGDWDVFDLVTTLGVVHQIEQGKAIKLAYLAEDYEDDDIDFDE